MTQPNSPGKDRNPPKKQRIYGTQFSSFGSDKESATPSSHEQALGAVVQIASELGNRAAFGTQVAKPIDQQTQPVNVERQMPPDDDRFAAVGQTRRAGPLDLQRVAASMSPRTSERVIASRIRSITESEKTLLLKQRSGDTEKPVGKSTWDLRIHRREVQGQITGIVNPIPASGEVVTGLQSALAVDDDAAEYEILGQLGAGNMGVVYHARQLSLNRELAIKTLKPTSTQVQHDQAMFVSEAVVTANLVHPNIIPIHDLGRTDDGKLFYSMKKVSGVAWNEIIRERTLEDNLDIFMKLCDAVAFAHSRGVINRDLKPENVVVGGFGEVVVLDWGLAITTERFEKRRSVLVDFRGGAGTPVYMAPELLDEELDRVGPASDVYLLGAILFEILEGFPPHLLRRIWQLTQPEDQFDAVYEAVMYNEIEEDVTHQGELMQIARRAMSTEPTDRFISVEALQNAIREYRITGRAEELMNSIDSRQTSDYTIYQSAVALYGEALLKWPDNRRAIDGDRNARLAYAKLAQKKGDIDLGLQVIAKHTDPVFAPVAAKLKKTRLIRTIIRGTWGVTTVSAVFLLILSFLAYSSLVEKNGELAEVQEKVELLNNDAILAKAEAESAKNEAKTAKLAAEAATIEGKNATRTAQIEVRKAEDDATQAKLDAAKAQTDADDANKKALTAKVEADKSVVEAEKAKEVARTASMDAQKAKAEAAEALTEKYKSESEGFTRKIEASEQLGDFTSVIHIANAALDKAASNPLIKQSEVALQKKIEDAIKNGGNAQIPLPDMPASAAISAAGNTVVAYSGGLEKSVSVIRNFGQQERHSDPVRIPVASKGSVKVAVSEDGQCFCLAAASEKQLWRFQDGIYSQLRIIEETTVPIGWLFFSPNGQHFYIIGRDRQATVEIYSLDSTSATLLLRQPLAGQATTDFRIRDVVLLPDETSLIVQFDSQLCSDYRISWSNDGKPKINQLAIEAPRLEQFSVDGLKQAPNQPERLFISPDGQRLGLTFSETLVFLPRIPNAPETSFSFAAPDESHEIEILRATYKVDDVQFSKNRQRVATGHKNRYLEIWDLKNHQYVACDAKGLFLHHPNGGGNAAILRGHADVVKAFAFMEGDPDRLLSVSTDETVRTWQVSTYAELVSQMQRIREEFERRFNPDSAGLMRPNSDRTVSRTCESERDHFSTGSECKSGNLLGYTLTAGPFSQPPEPRRIVQGQSIYSARFSPDGSRILIGADDLAAHAYDSQTGKEIPNASMLGRKDLLFDPSRNMFLEGHVSEISTIRFLPPKGALLLSADYFGSISAWDAAPDENGVGFERSRLLSEYSFSEFAVSDDGSLILAGGAITVNPGGELKDAKLLHKGVLWRTEKLLDSPSPAPDHEFKGQHPDFAITAVAIAPSCERIVTAGRRGKMVVWNVADENVIAEADGQHNRDQVSGIFFESETQLVSCGYDGKVFRSTVSGREMTAELVPRSEGQIDPAFIIRMRPSPDRQRFVTSDVSLLANGKGSKSGQLNITIWSTDGTRQLLSQPILIRENDKEQAFRHDISWSSDGRELMLVHDGVVAIFETTEWKLLRKFNCSQYGARPLRGAFAPAVDGRSDRIATFDGRISEMWDLPADASAGVHVAEFRSHARYSVTASYSSDDEYVATGSETLRIFDAEEDSTNHGATLYRLPVGVPHNSPLADCAFSPRKGDLRLATIDNEGTLAVWDWVPAEEKSLKIVSTESQPDVETPDWATGLKFGNVTSWSSDAKSLATLQNGIVSLWKFEENTPVRIELPLPDGLQCRFNQLLFSGNEPVLTAGGLAWSEANGEVISFAAVWDTTNQTPRLIARIDKSDRMHSAEVQSDQRTGITAIAIDDIRNEIVTGGVDGRLIRWQMTRSIDGSVPSLIRIADILVKSGTENPHSEMITAIDISAAGQILTADKGGHAILWPVPEK